MKDSKPVGRYSLILEKEGVKYCYDFEKGSFREFDKKGPYKTKLSKIDAFTSYCDSKEQFLTLQGLEDDGKLYISYNHEGENVFRWWIPVLVLINILVIGIEGLFLFLLLKKRRILDEKVIVDYSSDIVSINNEINVLQNAINRYKLDLKTLKKKSKNDNGLKQNYEKLNNEMKLINQALINISKENNKEGK